MKNWTVVYAFSPATTFDVPNVKATDLQAYLGTYYACIFVSAASIRRWNSEISIRLVTTETPPNYWVEKYQQLQIQIVKREYTYSDLQNYVSQFKKCFYIFDAIASTDENLIVLDPDTFCVNDLSNLLTSFPDRVGTLSINYCKHVRVNGISRAETETIFNEYRGSNLSISRHIGGECLVIPNSQRASLLGYVDLFWNWNLKRAERSLPFITTEEHLLSGLMAEMETFNLENQIARIWTSHSLRSIPEKISEMYIWHLPSEKNRAFKKLVGCFADQNSWAWRENHIKYLEKSMKIFGIQDRGPARVIKDFLGSNLNKFRKQSRRYG